MLVGAAFTPRSTSTRRARASRRSECRARSRRPESCRRGGDGPRRRPPSRHVHRRLGGDVAARRDIPLSAGAVFHADPMVDFDSRGHRLPRAHSRCARQSAHRDRSGPLRGFGANMVSLGSFERESAETTTKWPSSSMTVSRALSGSRLRRVEVAFGWRLRCPLTRRRAELHDAPPDRQPLV